MQQKDLPRFQPGMPNAWDASYDVLPGLHLGKTPLRSNECDLVVGVGGMGVAALLEVKGLVNGSFCACAESPDLPTDRVAFLGIDCDESSGRASSCPGTGAATLDRGAQEFLCLKKPTPGGVPLFAHGAPDYIRSWLNFEMDAPLMPGGTGAVRQAGRLFLFLYAEEIRAVIREKLRRMCSGQRMRAVHIHLLAGLAGGMGGGAFLDLAFIARAVAEELLKDVAPVYVYGYLFTPEVVLKRYPQITPWQREQFAMNGCAALKELDCWMNMKQSGGRFRQQYSRSFQVDQAQPPFSRAYLLDGGTAGDPWQESVRTASRVIRLALADHDCGLPDIGLQQRKDFPERLGAYAAVGLREYGPSPVRVGYYALERVFEWINDALDRTPGPGDAAKAIKYSLGLTGQVLEDDLAQGRRWRPSASPAWLAAFVAAPDPVALERACDAWLREIIAELFPRAQGIAQSRMERFRAVAGEWFADPARGPMWVARLTGDPATSGCETVPGLLQQERERLAAVSRWSSEETKRARMQLEEARFALLRAPSFRFALHKRAESYLASVENYARQVYREKTLEEAERLLDHFAREVQSYGERLGRAAQALLNEREGIWQMAMANRPTDEWFGDVALRNAVRQAVDENGEWLCGDLLRQLYGQLEDDMNSAWPDDALRGWLSGALGKSITGAVRAFVTQKLNEIGCNEKALEAVAGQMLKYSTPGLWLYGTAEPNEVLHTAQIWPEPEPKPKRELERALHLGGPIIDGGGWRVSVQTLYIGLPLWAYPPLAEYEAVYGQKKHCAGLHLCEGAEEDWAEMPSPIPQRRREQAGLECPQAVQEQEEELRALFQRCRELPVIRREGTAGEWVFRLYPGVLPNLGGTFSASGPDGPHRLRRAVALCCDWMQMGLPAADSTIRWDAAADTWRQEPPAGGEGPSFRVCEVGRNVDARAAEEMAETWFTGEYHNIHRARQAVKRYEALLQKREALREQYRKQAEWQPLALLAQGGLRAGDVFPGGEAQMTEIQRACPEWALSEALLEMAVSADPEKRAQAEPLLRRAETGWELFTAKEAAALLPVAEERCAQLAGQSGAEAERALDHYRRMKRELEAYGPAPGGEYEF